MELPNVLDAPKTNKKIRKPAAKCSNWPLTHKDSLEFIKSADTRATEKEKVEEKKNKSKERQLRLPEIK